MKIFGGTLTAPHGGRFLVFFEKTIKALRIAWNGEKIDQTIFQFTPTPDMCAEKFPLVSMEGWAEGKAGTDPGARTPIGASGIYYYFYIYFGGGSQSWKKLHAVHATRVDILVHKFRTYVAILELCGDFDYLRGKLWKMTLKILI